MRTYFAFRQAPRAVVQTCSELSNEIFVHIDDVLWPGHRWSHRRRVHNLRGTDLSINRQATIERTRRAKQANSRKEIYCARVSFPSTRGCCFRCAVVLPSSSSMLHVARQAVDNNNSKKLFPPSPNGLPGANSQHERLAAYGRQKTALQSAPPHSTHTVRHRKNDKLY